MSSRAGLNINGTTSDNRGQQSVAQSALRKAGLVFSDSDISMRTPRNKGGPMRTSSRGNSSEGGGEAGGGGGPSSRRGASSGGDQSGGGPSRMRLDPIAGNKHRARDRANPMGVRPGANGAGGGSGGGSERARHGKGKGRTGRTTGGGGIVTSLASDGEEFTASKAITAIKRFFAPRWNAEAKFLNLEAMHADPILKEENIPAPGQPGAPSQLTTVMWKLAGELYPDMTTLSVAHNNFASLVPIINLPDYLWKIQNLSLEGNKIQWTKDLALLSTVSNKKKRREIKPVGPTSSKGAEDLPCHRLPNLKELILVGNPVYDTAISVGNEEGYRQEVLARFPTLSMLDRKPVTPVEADFASLPGNSTAAASSGGGATVSLSAAAQTVLGNHKQRKAGMAAVSAAAAAGVEPKNFPVEIKEGFVDPAAQGIVPDFLSKYFSLFDTSRTDLLPAYAPSARMSITTNFHIPPRAKVEGWQNSKEMPNQKNLAKDPLTRRIMDRNLMRRGTKIPHLYSGHKEITDVLNRFPKTTHPLADASKFVFDAWVLPNAGVLDAMVGTSDGSTAASGRLEGEKPEAVLWIQVHGEFAEAPSGGIRSFDRVFLVAPVTPGSVAANAGWPCVILNDMITYRLFSHPKAWSSASIPTGDGSAALAATINGPSGSSLRITGPSTSGTAAAPPQVNGRPGDLLAGLPVYLQNQAPAPGLNEQQHTLSLQLAAQTQLTYPFAVQCLQENGWDPVLAMTNFQALKATGTIPAEAFVA
ncbi:nuclear mRNA export, poly(A)+RNA binding protein [Tilletia horrida]|uniref:mRNA export factor MEX67 n=1 Tax=Tilletia horrida TaxID=155126 RepID=A0AAN6GN87_9BASI|nr:nuclear mRNA export, poly(A)+RNA binding protein [Tilletia horrida]KAK0561327.1 nuclear mRNA export, poly(A)+RNA binding protein [Tilletia horrida]